MMKLEEIGTRARQAEPVLRIMETEKKNRVLKKVDGISFCELTSKDVVRHPLVQKIVQAYDEYEKKAKPENHSGRAKSTTRKRRENK